MKNNIVLIGMPGVGKSTVGVILAKILGYQFLDADLVIQQEEGKLLREIIEEVGTEGFIQVENRVNASLNVAKTVIATGGSVIYGKEAMGFGDVKLMGALGLYFGLSNIIIITLLSFLIGAVLSIILLATKIKKMDEYIPFGPFIVIGTFISIYVPFETIKNALMQIFTLGLYNK